MGWVQCWTVNSSIQHALWGLVMAEDELQTHERMPGQWRGMTTAQVAELPPNVHADSWVISPFKKNCEGLATALSKKELRRYPSINIAPATV